MNGESECVNQTGDTITMDKTLIGWRRRPMEWRCFLKRRRIWRLTTPPHPHSPILPLRNTNSSQVSSQQRLVLMIIYQSWKDEELINASFVWKWKELKKAEGLLGLHSHSFSGILNKLPVEDASLLWIVVLLVRNFTWVASLRLFVKKY